MHIVRFPAAADHVPLIENSSCADRKQAQFVNEQVQHTCLLCRPEGGALRMKDRNSMGLGKLQTVTEECAQESPESRQAQTIIAIASGGDWIPAEDLKERALDAVASAQNIALDFAEIHYLQGMGLQVILACHTECERLGKSLNLVNVSSDLRVWFDHCGASWLLGCMVNE